MGERRQIERNRVAHERRTGVQGRGFLAAERQRMFRAAGDGNVRGPEDNGPAAEGAFESYAHAAATEGSLGNHPHRLIIQAPQRHGDSEAPCRVGR
jgi:hypothetical protein